MATTRFIFAIIYYATDWLILFVTQKLSKNPIPIPLITKEFE